MACKQSAFLFCFLLQTLSLQFFTSAQEGFWSHPAWNCWQPLPLFLATQQLLSGSDQGSGSFVWLQRMTASSNTAMPLVTSCWTPFCAIGVRSDTHLSASLSCASSLGNKFLQLIVGLAAQRCSLPSDEHWVCCHRCWMTC